MPPRIDRKATVLGTIAVVLLAAAGGAAWWLQRTSAGTILRPDDAELVTRGKEIYRRDCASCHGKNLQGQSDWRTRLPNDRMPAPPHDETGHTWHHPDELLFKLTKQGTAALVGGNYKSDMPGFAGKLTDREIVAVLSYIKSTWPAAIRQRHDALNEKQP